MTNESNLLSRMPLFFLAFDLMTLVTQRLQVVLVPLRPAVQPRDDVVHEGSRRRDSQTLTDTAERLFLPMPDTQVAPACRVVKWITNFYLRLPEIIEWRDEWHYL